jgi:hypothetical protein
MLFFFDGRPEKPVVERRALGVACLQGRFCNAKACMLGRWAKHPTPQTAANKNAPCKRAVANLLAIVSVVVGKPVAAWLAQTRRASSAALPV